MKIIKSIAILLTLVVFPGLSYYYLSSGYHYRKEVIESVKPKGTFDEWAKSNQIKNIQTDQLRGKTSLIIYRNGNTMDSVYSQMIDQFKTSASFQILFQNYDGISEFTNETYSTKYSNTEVTIRPTSDMILIDENLQLRNKYMNEDESIKLLVRDVASILPRKIERDIKVLKDAEQ